MGRPGNWTVGKPGNWTVGKVWELDSGEGLGTGQWEGLHGYEARGGGLVKACHMQ